MERVLVSEAAAQNRCTMRCYHCTHLDKVRARQGWRELSKSPGYPETLSCNRLGWVCSRGARNGLRCQAGRGSRADLIPS